MTADPLLKAEGLCFAYPGQAPLWPALDFTVRPGLSWVRGGDGRGKTSLLRLMAGRLAPCGGRLQCRASSICLPDLGDPALDAVVARDWLAARRTEHPAWHTQREAGLCEAYGLLPHLDKALFMLSTGSRRKLGLVAAAASGAELCLLDVPFAGLDAPSRRVLMQCLAEAAQGNGPALVVADAVLPPGWPLGACCAVIELGD